MKLTIFPASGLIYESERWVVFGEKIHLPSVSPTVVPNIGYGGYGWLLKIITAPIDTSDISARLFKKGKLINTFSCENGECVVVPQGGRIEDYAIKIERQ